MPADAHHRPNRGGPIPTSAAVRRYLNGFLATAVLGAAGLVGLNRWLVPADRVGGLTLETRVAAALAGGSHVVLPTGLDEAALKWSLADQVQAPLDLAVLGSSHSLRLSAGLPGAGRLVNFSISGATLAEHLVTSAILSRRGILPKNWIILVDPWLFDRESDFGNWRARAAELTRFEELLGRRSTPPVAPIFSPRVEGPRTEHRLSTWTLGPVMAAFNRAARSLSQGVMTTDRADLQSRLLLADGSLRPNDEDADAGRKSLGLARRQLSERRDLRRFGTYREIDAGLWQQFTTWISWCREQGGQVWLVLSPYHPAIYSDIVAQPGNRLQDVEARVRSLAAREAMTVIGSYDPSATGVRDLDFADGDHLLLPGLERLFAPMAAGRTPR